VVAPSPSSSVLALPQTASSPDLRIAEEDHRDEHMKHQTEVVEVVLLEPVEVVSPASLRVGLYSGAKLELH
jgi:hypothetical protein